ncbi:MAG: IS21 family transposase [Candidatus Lokiarchaeota archaeon]|nr:IS21 family transposase [Candidatus Lokiarchaeota archaeon]
MLSDEEWFIMRDKDRHGISISQVARENGINWRTAKKYMQSPSPPKYRSKKRTDGKLDPFKDHIKGMLEDYPYSAKKIMEEIKNMGYTGSYTLVKDFVYPMKKDRAIPAELRYETPPGVQSQTDWFDFGYIIVDEIKRKLWGFSTILGYSRTRYLEFTTECKTPTFIKCHLNAFDYFGGYTETNLYDNTKNVVLKRLLKSSDSIWNPLFKDFFTYYNFTPRLCKPGIPGAKTKGKIERTGRFIREDFFMGLKFDSISDLNAKALAWCNKVNSQEHSTTHEIPFDRLKEENLRPVKGITPFQIIISEFRKVSRDCFISYRANKYSVPWKHAGREAKLLVKDDKFEVEIGGEIVCVHEIIPGKNRLIKIKEHFAGLYKEILYRNRDTHLKRIQGHVSSDSPILMDSNKASNVKVEQRDLSTYDDLIMEGDLK